MEGEELYDEQVYEELAPLVGYTMNSSQSSLIKLHSLRADKTLHIFRFTSPVVKFLSSMPPSNQLLVLL
jgi:hypothetical protein